MKTIYKNAKIYTADPTAPFAEAFSVSDGRIEAVGSAEEVLECCSGFEIADLGGRRVIPGLIDAHMHALLLADYGRRIACLPPAACSVADILEAVRREAEKKSKSRERAKKAGEQSNAEWIRGWGYDEGKLREHRPPTRQELDAASKDFPVCLVRSCLHIVAVNSRALELAGIDENTKDPEGGHIARDEDGLPTGILEENARFLVYDAMPKGSLSERADDIAALGQLLASQGIVAVSDMGDFDGLDPFPYYERALEKGFKQEVAIYYFWDLARKSGHYRLSSSSMQRSRKLRTAGLKLISDGSISGRTAWVDEPYLRRNGIADEPLNYGIDELPDELFEDALRVCREAGCQLSVHAMGGRAIARVLDRLSREDNWLAPELREAGVPHCRMEHITEPREVSIKKAAEKGIAFAMQPVFQYCEIESYLENLGPERTKRAYPIKSMLEKGVKIALSTDAPATSWALPSDPWTNLKAACTRRAFDGTDVGQDERLDIETALRLYTKEAAEVCGFEGLGMIKPGYKASFAVLEEDPFEAASESLDKIKVAATFIEGECIFGS